MIIGQEIPHYKYIIQKNVEKIYKNTYQCTDFGMFKTFKHLSWYIMYTNRDGLVSKSEMLWKKVKF
jgi:hypothetical protein